MSYYKPEIQNWIDATWNLIQAMLTLAGIPFEKRDNHAHCHNLVFPWAKGADVAIGILHSYDEEVQVNGKNVIRCAYPSIETYGFEWDHGDITIFGTPEEFLKKISGEYGRHLMQSVKKNKETHTTWKSNKSLDSKPSDTWGSNASI